MVDQAGARLSGRLRPITIVREPPRPILIGMDTHQNARRSLRFGTVVTAVADLIPQRAQDLASKVGASKIYRSDEEMSADPDIDVVCLATPSGDHAAHAVRAMQAGKHVVVEKPMEISLAASSPQPLENDRARVTCPPHTAPRNSSTLSPIPVRNRKSHPPPAPPAPRSDPPR